MKQIRTVLKKTGILLLAVLILTLPSCGRKTAQQTQEIAEIATLPAEDPAGEAAKLTAETGTDPAGETVAETQVQEPETEAQVPEAEEPEPEQEPPAQEAEPEPAIDRDGTYSSKEDVALYILTYGELPSNFITKKQAKALGWEGGSVEKVAPGKCIGGDYFGNYEGLLPEKKGREYHECDIDTLGKKSRGAKRIIFSNDGLIYYTDDHYESFTLLYGEP
ncbi:MAG: ribonuclease [Lachnospiraceae bacterium]|nr:ribonuclease [Lachnospiraceae bacterium]